MPNIGPPLWAAMILASASPPVISFVDIVAPFSPLPVCGACAGRGRVGGADRVSDCVVGQAFCHGLLSRMMALRMVRSFRAVAMRATILGFPAATRRSRKALRVGLDGRRSWQRGR